MFKKTVMFLFLFSLVLSSAFASGGKEQAAEAKPAEITLMGASNNEDHYNDMIAAFHEKQSEVVIKPIYVPWPELFKKLLVSFGGGNAPDTFFLHWSWVVDIANMDALADLGAYLDKSPLKKNVMGSALGPWTWKGSLYGMPFEAMNHTWYYRTDYFAEAGIKEFPVEWEDFAEVARKLTDESKSRYGSAFRGGRGGFDFTTTFISQNGGALMTPDMKVGIDEPAAVEAIDWYTGLYRNGGATPPSAPTDSYRENVAQFGSGVVAIYLHHIGSLGLHKKALGEGKFAVGPMLRRKKIAPGNFLHAWPITSQSKNPDAVWAWIEHYLSDEMQQKHSQTKGVLPVTQSAIDILRPIYLEKEPQYYKEVFDAVPHFVTLPPVPKWSKILEGPGIHDFQELLYDKITAQEFCDRMAGYLRDGVKEAK